jgi:ribonuclease P protein component
VHGRRIVLFIAPGSGDVAYVAGRKIGDAVERNRARRILRAALKEIARDGVTDHDVVLVAREQIRGAKSHDLAAEMGELLEQGRVGG